jgi:cation diffusion facilitator family transporter
MHTHDERPHHGPDDHDADHPHVHAPDDHGDPDHDHSHDHGHGGHVHDHGSGLLGRMRHTFAHSHAPHEQVDSVLESSDRGIWALKLSLVGLGITALVQVVIVLLSGSVGLLADTIHNFGDATTSIPLWIAFALVKRGRNRSFTYGYGRAEDVAGAIIVLVIFFSAVVASYESIRKLVQPQPMEHLWWVAGAAIIGFLGNEAVAQFRIGIGREIGSAALIADGQHSRVDGFTSLAVLIGVVGVAVGIPILDPLVGLAITVTILFIVKDTAIAVWRRLMGAIEPEILEAVEHAPLHVSGVHGVHEVRAHWMGHRILADLHISVDPDLSVQQAHAIVEQVEMSLGKHVAAFGGASIHVCPREPAPTLPPTVAL